MDSTGTENGNDSNDFALVSGFYGPGAIGCWYYLITLFAVSWAFNPEETRRMRCPTPDFAAMMLYPVVAIGHLVIQIRHFPPEHSDYLAANLANAIKRWGGLDGAVLPLAPGRKSWYQIDASSELRKQLYPRIVAMNLALRVADIFSDLCLLFILRISLGALVRHLQSRNPRRTPWLVLYSSIAGLLWSWVSKILLASLIWHEREVSRITWSMGPRWSRLMMWAIGLPVWYYMLWRWYRSLTSYLGLSVNENKASRHRGNFSILGLLTIVACSVVVIIGPICYRGTYFYTIFPYQFYLPETGFSIAELDQAAALTSGAVAFLLNALRIWNAKRQPVCTADDDGE
ncbi:unnamed protein product [Clonostachys solani]|uniref:Uncharacterized protein n=1 Tax=Clonostachys solani TaxID=160281 RepID=A0A9P0ES05_9HYPO|nr:unnamed protein product [Clonostachys solani]